MGVQVETAKIEADITVVGVSGNLTFEETDAFISMFRILLNQGGKRILLDLSGLDQIDSMGGTSLIH